jgi:stromal membrane-associated protein
MSPITTNQSSANQDLFGLLDSQSEPIPKPVAPPQPSANSAFNLSNPLPLSQPATQQTPTPKPATNTIVSLSSNFDPWGSTEAWGAESKNTTITTTQPTLASPAPSSSSSKPAVGGLGDLGWGGASSSTGVGGGTLGMGTGKALSPEITKDDDFGGWSGAPAQAAGGTGSGGVTGKGTTKTFVSNDDLFSNVWE